MAETQEIKVYDIYSSLLNFKKAISTLNRPGVDFTWIPQKHERRLKAYELLESYYYNYSREYRFAPESGGASYNDTIREFGDSAWVCNTIKAKLLGDGVNIAMEMPDELKDFEKAETPEASLVALRGVLLARENYIKRWWKNNNVFLSVDENETKCSYLGDCVYYLEWKTEWIEGVNISRPNIKTYDPGFIFPFLNCNDKSIEGNGQIVKDRVIIVWEESSKEILDNVAQDQYFVIFRDIYELRAAGEGQYKCYRKHGYYKYNTTQEINIKNLIDDDLLNAEDAKWIDLGIDFMPFEIVPNISVQGQDFGLSNIHFLIGIIDSMINNDTDLTRNSELLGGATVFGSGKDVVLARDSVTKQPKAIAIQPNTFYPLGEGGSATLLNTSTMQTALLDTAKALREKLIRNSNITEIGAGMLDVNQLSTISLKMFMQPLLDMINPMRQQRNMHYSNIFYNVQRLYQLFGTEEEKKIFQSPLYDFNLVFGDIVPGDEKAKLEEYNLLLTLTDEQTVLEKMKDDGYNIDINQVLERKKTAAAEAMAANADLFGMRRSYDANSPESNNENEPEASR
jgi:hypothetical protein